MYGEWWQGKPLDGHGDSIKAEWRHFVLRKTTCDDIRGKLVDQNDMPSRYGMQEVVLCDRREAWLGTASCDVSNTHSLTLLQSNHTSMQATA